MWLFTGQVIKNSKDTKVVLSRNLSLATIYLPARLGVNYEMDLERKVEVLGDLEFNSWGSLAGSKSSLVCGKAMRKLVC